MSSVSTDKIEREITRLEEEATDFEERARNSRDTRDWGHGESDAAMCRRFTVKVLKGLLSE